MKKKLLSVMIALCLACVTAASPYSTENVCAKEQKQGDFGYEIRDDGTIEIIYYDGNDANAVIPAEIRGKQVTSIGHYAFSDCKSKSIFIPDSVTSIGEFAFERCKSLKSINIPDSVTTIGLNAQNQSAFYGCSSLEAINVDGNNKSYSSINGIVYSKDKKIVLDCPEGKKGSIDIPDGVTEIAASSFFCCMGLENISIPDSVTTIGEWAFHICENLKSISIPAGVTSINDNTFGLCKNLKSISIPDSVISIGSSAFSDCIGLRSIVIPDGVKSIGSSAFWGCKNLKSVTILNGITSIGAWAFQKCSNLKTITIKSTKIKSVGTDALKGINPKAKIKVPASKLKAYKKLFKNKGQGKKVRITK